MWRISMPRGSAATWAGTLSSAIGASVDPAGANRHCLTACLQFVHPEPSPVSPGQVIFCILQ